MWGAWLVAPVRARQQLGADSAARHRKGAARGVRLVREASPAGGLAEDASAVVMLTYDRPILTCAHNRRKQGDHAESAPCG
jgi:hypothetical protein